VIGRIHGVIAEQGLDGSIVVDVGGVGYELFVPLGTIGRVQNGGGAVTFHVHTHVREDALVLYGFASAEDRLAFRALIGVNGVGPKLAIAILGALRAEELALAVARDDKAAFKGIPGVGRKTVERLLLDLKDKLAFVSAAASIAPSAPRPAAPPMAAEQVIGALVQMGYKRTEAERAVEGLGPEGEDASVEQLLRLALSALG